jgi:nicotinic acid mononucleotide adenylyltransferase
VQSTVSKVVGVASSYAGGMHNITTTSKSSAMSSQTPSRAMSVPSSGSSQQSNLSNLSYSSNPANIPRHFNILQKISVRMDELFAKYSPEMLLKQRKLAVLVGSGSYNPLTRMHLRNYFLAKQYLEKHHGYIVLGSLLSPSHPNTVRERYRTNPLEILPAPHRLVIAQLLVNNSQWLTIDPWEITRRRPMDYLALIEHTKYVLQDCYPDLEIQVFYLCKSNTVPTLSPQAIKTLNAQVVTVCRIAEAELLQNSLQSVHNSKQWLHRGLVHIVEDSAILDASLDMVTSRKVREKIKNNESIETLVGAKIQEYVLAHKLGAKVRKRNNASFHSLNSLIIRLSFYFVSL